MNTIMYIHGYGSDGNAMKGQLLRRMIPQCRVVSPTFDYDRRSPWNIQEQIRNIIEHDNIKMLVGSSFGGYHSLCATTYFHGTVWVINPVHEVLPTIKRVILNPNKPDGKAVQFLDQYEEFDKEVFREQAKLNQSNQWSADTSLYFALSIDDELLGDHQPLLKLFPKHRQVIWKDHSGHRFLRFEELADAIASSL